MRRTLLRSNAGPVATLLVLALLFAACSPGGRHKFLKVFFDGIPDRTRTPADPSVAPTDPRPPAGGPQPSPEPPEPPDPFANRPFQEPNTPLEEARSFEELMKALPLDYSGGVDWVKAEANGLAKPQLLPLPGTAEVGPPFTLDSLVYAGKEFPDRPFLDLDLNLVPEQKPLFAVRFPHAAHTQRLNCSGCHPEAGKMRVPMERILAGEACGKCHGKVSFDPEISCARCHPQLLPADESVLQQEVAHASAEPVEASPGLLERGQTLYARYCAFCHGDEGDGQGRLSEWLDTKPRDFTAGKYKFRSTIGTSLPTDTDLFRTVTRGVPGTSMPSWSMLSPDDRWALVHFIKTFSQRFEKEQPSAPMAISEPPEATDEVLAQGKDLYKQAGCHSCHGLSGHGDGPSAATLKDDWGRSIRPFSFTSGRPLKSGRTVSDLYRIVMSGFPGTPMPGFGEVLPPEMAWALASYVDSLRGSAMNPFAVRGDIEFDRAAIEQMEAVQKAAAESEELSPEELAADELFLLAGKDIPPAIFPHWFHRIRFKCSSCHPAIFEMKAGANPITMTAMRRGEFCAKCHNGNVAWEVAFTTCVRCHVAG